MLPNENKNEKTILVVPVCVINKSYLSIYLLKASFEQFMFSIFRRGATRLHGH